ncbi:TetR/AcrR family transcriptional regulator [Saccharothrix coeruleofusca]|uniref:TetR family transcriptional regulator n=1 Tax=Saccharothrix coeruleofusca TaxID=33919 RepID=A0A918AUD5_9PSEU|nr:TetR/AcrR family transcriptional regulator [Saccharothrix coeruleofusca]GGP85967.1 TetR family transcriptional regulator [Saccharothrix coeruleofusca]
MDDTAAGGSARREGIVRAATGAFLRFGFRKTSMEDVAKAAAISRQGLYLHFETKEALFRAVVEQMLADLRSTTWEALDREDVEAGERLARALEAFHGVTVGTVNREVYSELLSSARSFALDRMSRMEEEFVAGMAALLTSTGHAAAWEGAGLSAAELAQNLFDASAGAKHESGSLDDYRRRVRVATRIITSRPRD